MNPSTPLSSEVRQALGAIAESPGSSVDDAEIIAFRAGTLAPAEHERVAAAIAAHPESRALLRAFAADAPRAEDQAWMAGMRATQGRRRVRTAGWIGGAIAVAALVAALVMRTDLNPSAYALEGPFGGVVDTRGDTDVNAPPSMMFAPTSRIRVLARPTAGAKPATACTAFVRDANGQVRGLPPDAITLAPSGVCRFETDVAQAAPAPGQYTLFLILGGRPDASADTPWPGWDAAGADVLSTPFTLSTKASP